MREILTIYRKELKEVLRDRKTLIFMIVLPTVVLPMLFYFMFKFIGEKEAEARSETIELAIINSEVIPELTELFKAEDSGFSLIEDILQEEQLKEAIREDKIKLGLVFPNDAQQPRVNLYAPVYSVCRMDLRFALASRCHHHTVVLGPTVLRLSLLIHQQYPLPLCRQQVQCLRWRPNQV